DDAEHDGPAEVPGLAIEAIPRIADLEDDVASGTHRAAAAYTADPPFAGLDGEPPPRRHGVARAEQEVDDDVLQLCGIDLDLTQDRGQPDLQLDVGSDQPPGQRLERTHHLVQAERAGRLALVASEREKLAREEHATIGRLTDPLHVVPPAIVG